MKQVTIGQIALLGLAFVIFYVGLVIGLTRNPTLGTLLWIVAGVLILVDMLWWLRAKNQS